MTTAKIEWDYDAFYEKLHAFERCGVAFVTGDGTRGGAGQGADGEADGEGGRHQGSRAHLVTLAP